MYAKMNHKSAIINITVSEKFITDIFVHLFKSAKFAIMMSDYKKLEKEYGINCGELLIGYIKHIIENLLGGPYNNRTARELAWGFYDKFLTQSVFLLIIIAFY